jgi:sugar O-acyltransferase (sialic acid O-acetyltransferase NeuD family)
MIPLLILGAGGTARDILDWLPALAAAGREYRCMGLLDDDPAKRDAVIADCAVMGRVDEAVRWPDCRFIDALGSPGSFRHRAEIVARSGLTDDRFETIVHPLAWISSSAVLGPGSLIYPFTFIGPDVRAGAHVTVLSHSSVNHDCQIGDYSILAAHTALAGDVSLGDHCYLGMGATVIGGTHIGRGAMIGMGSVIRHDVPAHETVAGNPTRPLRPHQP